MKDPQGLDQLGSDYERIFFDPPARREQGYVDQLLPGHGSSELVDETMVDGGLSFVPAGFQEDEVRVPTDELPH